MTILSNQPGSKKVKISTDATGLVRAMFIQVYNNEEQVLQAKSFSNIANAEKWSKKILN